MSQLKVRDLMSTEVQTVSARDDLDFASMVMRLESFRHLPVVDEGKLVGLVSDRDILRAQVSSLSGLAPEEQRVVNMHIDVAEMMTREVETIEPDAPAIEAARRMRARKVGCLPVVKGGELVGIVTATDFLDLAIRKLGDTRD